MPIVQTYNADPRLLGRVAQQAGEGRYRQGLSALATSDANRSTSTQLSLLDLVEGARRTNLGAQVSRSNTLNQISSAQQRQAFDRVSNERMAGFQARAQMNRLQTSGGLNARAATSDFNRKRILGQDRLGQEMLLGEREFGFDQKMQEQRDFAAEERQRAEMRQRQLSGIIETLDPQSRGQIRTIQFQRQRFQDDQRKNGRLRDDEFQQQLGTFDQRINEVIQVAGQQPSLQEQFQQRGMWIDDPNSPGIQHYVGIDPKSGKLHKVIGGDQQGSPTFSTSDWNTFYNNRAKAKQHYRGQVTTDGNGMSVPLFSEEQIESFINTDYPQHPGMQGLNSGGFGDRYGDTYNAQQSSSAAAAQQGAVRQQAPPQQAAMGVLEQLEQLPAPVSAAARVVRGIFEQFGFNPAMWPVEAMRRYRAEFPKIESLLQRQ